MIPFVTVTEVLGEGTWIISVEGELDLDNSPRLETELRTAIEDGARHLILDLTACEFLCSSALTVLLKTRKHVDDHGSLSLIAPQFTVRRVFEITHLDGVFEIHPTRADALRAKPSGRTSGTEEHAHHPGAVAERDHQVPGDNDS